MNDKYGDDDDSTAGHRKQGDEDISDVELSPTSRLLKQARARKMNKSSCSKLKSEMIKYESFSVAPRESSVLYWWKNHASLLPILAKIARSILVIPSSSAKSERVFSTGGNTVAVKRTRLNPSRVEHLIVIKENLSKLKEFELFHDDYDFSKAEESSTTKTYSRVHLSSEAADFPVAVDDDLEDEELEDIEDDFLDDDAV